MHRLGRFIGLNVALLFFLGAQDPNLAENTCDLGAKIRLFESYKDKKPEAGFEKLLISLLQEPLFVLDDENYVEALILLIDYPSSKSGALEKISTFVESSKAGILGSAFRERRANALTRLLEVKPGLLGLELKDKIVKLLVVEFAETFAAKRMSVGNLGDTDWLRRIEVLSDRNENAMVLAEITQKEARLKLEGKYSCRVQFLFGKALRKSRRYQEALSKLNEVAEKCDDDDGRDAAFLLARLAAISPSQENMKYFDAFEKKYPTHSYMDDVLLFKASAYESMNRKDDAKRTLKEIATSQVVGDMKLEAMFRLAFLHALDKDTPKAIQVLRASLDTKMIPAAPLMQIQRAKYWSARLVLFPDVFTLNKAKTFKKLIAARRELESLAASPQKTLYSWLAAELLKESNSKEEGLLPRKVERSKQLEVETTMPKMPSRWADRFNTIFCMISKGYEAEAKRIVALIEPSEIRADERVNVAHKFAKLRYYADAFRFAHGAINEDAESATDMEILTLLYPKAHENEVKNASSKIGIPESLLFGLMREESRFDARAISWAGARGVFQLMPQVAKEEALKLKIMDLSDEAMLNPEINILLGAEHLKEMLDNLEHPLFGVAAYNAGLKSVKEWQDKYKRIRALDTFVENIPFPETRNYVKRVASSWINYTKLYADEESLFGLEISAKRDLSKQAR